MKNAILISFIIFSSLSLFSQSRPPEIPADDSLYNMGFLNVLHYGADSSGATLSTNAIKRAMRMAQQYQVACYFPSGTYLVDDTLTGFMACIPPGAGCTTDRRKPVYLIGATNPRPVIKLADNTTKYTNSSLPLPVIWFWAYPRDIDNPGSTDPADEQADINFNMVIRNIVINLGVGNKGAIGIRFAGAQGSTIEDVKVIGNDGFAGIAGCPGHAGGCYNIEIEGGRHAFFYETANNGNAIFPTLVGITCKNQTAEVFKFDRLWMPMLIVGFHITKPAGNLVAGWATRGGISMIDGIIDYTGTSVVASAIPNVTNSLYLQNVYIRNCSKILATDAGSSIPSSEWSHIEDYRYTQAAKGMNLINGSLVGGISALKRTAASPPDPITLIRKHTWDRLTFASLEMRYNTDFVNVFDPLKMTGPAGPAKGNGTANDTEALQWAIDNYSYVFLPKGTFMINKTLNLKAGTQLYGAGKTYSVIRAINPWGTSGKTMIQSPADADATTSISFIMLETDVTKHKDMNRITWQSGPKSTIRDIMIGLQGFATTSSLDHQMMIFKGQTAGGRVYAFAAENNSNRELTYNSNYRHILIDGISLPLYFYMCNVERIRSGVQFEIKNSSNVNIYYLKSEARSDFGFSTPLLINNSNNIGLYCLSGLMELTPGMALLEVNNSTNIIATDIKSFSGTSTSGWFNVKETFNGVTKTMTPDLNLGVFSRNTSVGVTEQTALSGNMINIYPNPSGDRVFVDNTDMAEKKIYIQSITGCRVYEDRLPSGISTVNLKLLNQGVYVVSILHENGYLQHSKLIKE